MSADTDKELVWEKLSTLPDPILSLNVDMMNLDLISVRTELQKALKISLAELDELIDGYASRQK